MLRRIGWWLGYVWALPNTLLGVACLPLVAVSGGRVRFQQGVMELYGGFAAWLLRTVGRGARAMALGHVILARDRAWLEFTRDHEHVHVRQYTIWGPLFLPAYAGSSLLCLLRGQDPYRDNWFERQAYARHPRAGGPPSQADDRE